MKTSILRSGLRVGLVILGITFASQAFARHYYHSASSTLQKSVAVEYSSPTGSNEFGLNTQSPVFIGTLRVPYTPASVTVRAFDGGHDGDDDTTGGDTTGDHGNGDTTDLGDHGHHGDDDSTDVGDNDTTGDHHEGHDGNDTVDCHHHADNDSTDVDDSTQHSMFNGGHQSIVIRSHGNQANITFQFVNNLSTGVKISGMSLSSGKNFTIISGAPTAMHPANLAAGAKLTLKIAFNASDRDIHSDQLLVQSNSSQTTSTITLTGQQIAASASVSNSLPAGVSVTMLPNPMTTSLKTDLSGVEKASVAVYDMNGKQVFSSSISSGEWIWNGMSLDGTTLLSGTYIVRISGTSSNNAPFVSTQKIVLQK